LLDQCILIVKCVFQASGAEGTETSAERGAESPNSAQQQTPAAAGADLQTLRTGSHGEPEQTKTLRSESLLH